MVASLQRPYRVTAGDAAAGGARRPVADMTKYPMFREWSVAADSARPSVSNRGMLPSATGDVTYIDPALVEAAQDLGAGSSR